MFVIEHHGKELLASQGVTVPAGIYFPAGGDVLGRALPNGPLVVKAQVAGGGRGKAGAIQFAESRDEACQIIERLDGTRVNGEPIQGFRIEQRITGAHEAYVSLSIDAAAARIRLMIAAHGGVDVEANVAGGADVCSILTDSKQLAEAASRLSDAMPPTLRVALSEAGSRLAEIFLRYEATLLEINPLFILPGRSWIAGDVKLVVDDNALVRQPAIRRLLEQHPDIYPESARKLAHGFDYVEVDELGEIGLITTGAGLSMQLIDELKGQGRRPLNFCDIRSGQFRGNPARLITVMRWIASRPQVRVVLVNIFAGITDLTEFARLFVEAAGQVPELRVPIIARLIGRNLADARQILCSADLAVTMEPDLDRAVGLTLVALAREGARRG